MTIVGLDLSLTSTGVATINGDDIKVRRITSTGKATATLGDRRARLSEIAWQVPMPPGLDLVAIEGPSYASQMGSQHDRAGLWWLLVDMYMTANNDPDTGEPTLVVEIPPKCLKKYATGKGSAAKDAVLAAVIRRYPQVEVNSNDEADALILAAMGARWLGEPIEDSLPAAHLAAMGAVNWPGYG